MKKAIVSGLLIGALLVSTCLFSAQASANHVCYEIDYGWFIYLWCPPH